MFLRNLKETEKQAFLCLVRLIIRSDNVIEESEMETLKIIMGNMNYTNLMNDLSEQECYQILSDSELSVKKAVYLELLLLANANKEIDSKEENYIDNILENLNLTGSFAKKAQKWVKQYFKLYEDGNRLIKDK